MFHEEGTADIIKEIQKGFDEMHKRFDRLGEKIDDMRQDIKDTIRSDNDFYNSYTSYDENINKKLVLLRAAASKLNSLPGNPEARDELKVLCEHLSHRPQYLLAWMHDHFTGARAINFAKAIYEWAKFSRADLQQLLISFAYDASELGLFITTRCLPVQGNSSTNSYDIALSNAYDAVVAQSHLFEIRNALSRIDDEQLYGWQDEMETDIKKLISGIQSNEDDSSVISEQILEKLKFKYYWNIYQVLVFRLDQPAEEFNQEVFYNPDYMRYIASESVSKMKWAAIIHWSLNEGDPLAKASKPSTCDDTEGSLTQIQFSPKKTHR